MMYFRKLLTHRKLLALLAIGMLLRSTIAVGYMLDTNPDNGNLFSIMLCEGPAGINAIAGIDKQHHGEHHGHHADDVTDKEHAHAVQDHPLTSCSFWSASSISLFVETAFYDNSNYFLSDEIVVYERHLKRHLSDRTGFARAPPALG